MNPLRLLLIALLFISQVAAQTCAPSNYFNGQRCAPCQTNCLCSSEGGCTSCMPGYTYDALFKNCLACPVATSAINVGCKECCYQVQGPAFVCSTCPPGPYVFQVGGQCISLAGCTTTTQQGVCTACASGYYLNQGICSPCDASCATCLDSSLCRTCNTGYYNATDVSFSLCQACSVGCTTCSSSTVCTACTSGYRLTAPSCTACASYCLTCTAAGCSACNSVSGLVGTVCYLCTDPAKQGSTGCTSCVGTALRTECTSCSAGYYLNAATKACVACSTTWPNSILCSSSAPLQCSSDSNAVLTSRYYLVGSTCVANTNNCKSMLNNLGQCSSCYFTAATGYYTLTPARVCSLCSVTGCLTYSSTCQCLSCRDRYQFINGQCIACQNLHCYKCQASVSACEQCAPSYGRMSSACVLCQPTNCQNCDGDNTACAICNTGFYMSGGRCYTCQSNCLTCLSNTQCTSCAVGTYLQANGRCKTLPSNCIQIDATTLASAVGSCKRCDYGYILMEGSCYPCSISLFNVPLPALSSASATPTTAPTTTRSSPTPPPSSSPWPSSPSSSCDRVMQ